jgi:hypothetical protein
MAMIPAREADQPAQMMMSHQGKKWDSYVCRKRKEPASALFDMDDRENNMFDISANRRELLIAPLLATMPTAFLSDHANASPIDPAIRVSRHRTEALRPTSRLLRCCRQRRPVPPVPFALRPSNVSTSAKPATHSQCGYLDNQ